MVGDLKFPYSNSADYHSGQFALFEHSVLADQIYLGLFVTLSPTDHLRYVEEPIRIEKWVNPNPGGRVVPLT